MQRLCGTLNSPFKKGSNLQSVGPLFQLTVGWNTACFALIVVFASGCGRGPDLDGAKTAVKTALDQWKESGTPKQLVEQAIEIVDPDWSAGYRLLDYELKSVTAQPQQGPRVVAKLQLQDRAGKKLNKEVAYEVLLGDKVKIGRDAFHIEQP